MFMMNNQLIEIYVSYIFYNISIGLYSSFLPVYIYFFGASMFIISLISEMPTKMGWRRLLPF